VVGTAGCQLGRLAAAASAAGAARAITLWVGLAALLVVLVLVPKFRTGSRIWLWLYALLVAWFVVARTKTVSWRLVAGLFATLLWWSLVGDTGWAGDLDAVVAAASGSSLTTSGPWVPVAFA
jgi:hypothetical protein